MVSKFCHRGENSNWLTQWYLPSWFLVDVSKSWFDAAFPPFCLFVLPWSLTQGNILLHLGFSSLGTWTGSSNKASLVELYGMFWAPNLMMLRYLSVHLLTYLSTYHLSSYLSTYLTLTIYDYVVVVVLRQHLTIYFWLSWSHYVD